MGAAVLTLAASVLVAGPAGAQSSCEETGCVDVVAVDGLIDGIVASNIIDAVTAADRSAGVEAVVLQIDSAGSAVSPERLGEVASVIRDSSVPVTTWIGPSGAVAFGGAAELVAVSDASGIAPGAEIGDVGDRRLAEGDFGKLFPDGTGTSPERVYEGEAAVDAGLVDRFAPIVRDHIVNIEGVKAEITEEDGEAVRAPTALVRFSKLPLGTQFLHTVASPSVAYLLLVAGLGLLLFEFYTAGVGIAGVTGAVCVMFAGYGVAALPHHNWALALVVASLVGFAVDVQSGVPRLWSVISMVAFTVGSLFLFSEFRPTWLALAAGVVGMAATVFTGMPTMVRTRFGTPTIEREFLLGEPGEAVIELDPDGTVTVSGARWRARATSGAPVPTGTGVRVIGIDGLILEVEPEGS